MPKTRNVKFIDELFPEILELLGFKPQSKAARQLRTHFTWWIERRYTAELESVLNADTQNHYVGIRLPAVLLRVHGMRPASRVIIFVNEYKDRRGRAHPCLSVVGARASRTRSDNWRRNRNGEILRSRDPIDYEIRGDRRGPIRANRTQGGYH